MYSELFSNTYTVHIVLYPCNIDRFLAQCELRVEMRHFSVRIHKVLYCILIFEIEIFTTRWAKGFFCYAVFNLHMSKATEVQLWTWCFHMKFLLFTRPIHVWRSRTQEIHSRKGLPLFCHTVGEMLAMVGLWCENGTVYLIGAALWERQSVSRCWRKARERAAEHWYSKMVPALWES
jgi:hypothetical protein